LTAFGSANSSMACCVEWFKGLASDETPCRSLAPAFPLNPKALYSNLTSQPTILQFNPRFICQGRHGTRLCCCFYRGFEV
jgi:hypothetical protein